MTLAIETNDLSKTYGHLRAVEGVNLRVEQGEIYGFIGLNGAGKTTTIRTLLGMIRPSAGSVQVLGESVGPNGRGPWKRVGHLVESPAAYPELTVRENLEIARRLHSVSNVNATTRVIDHLGLSAYANRKAGELSTGNLQRLGLARALLHEPELLILDEPTNGLDPAGVVEIRNLIANLAHTQGVTVFMSSHILTEVARLATRIGIIHRGHLIQELDAAKLEALRARRLEIQTRNLPAACHVLAQAGLTAQSNGDRILLQEPRTLDAPEEIAALLVNAGTPPFRLAVEQEDLEQYFMRLTGAKP